VQIACWIATMWTGRPRFATPMLFVCGVIATFVIGGQRARIGLAICAILGVLFLGLRRLEFLNLNTRWDTDAYGSAVWATLGFHTSLIVVELAEVIAAAAILFRRRAPVHFMSDTADIAIYWYFLVLVWVPLYVMVYLLPR
jgi:heme/copper-type cytochrome/quinol oxidase subunit 3